MVKILKNALQVAVLGLVLVGTQAVAANFNNLSFMGTYVERHPTTIEVFHPFMEEAKENTNGEVTFNYFSSNVLFPESEGYAVYADGRTDFGAFRPGIFPGVVNLIEVIAIPGMAKNAIVGSLLAEEIATKYPEVRAEFPENSELLSLWASAAYQIHTIAPIKTLEDLKGLKIIAWDAPTRDILEKLGANPLRLMAVDTYLSLSKGMADGVICPVAAVRSFKISDVAKHHFMLDLSVSSFVFSAYKPLWDEFSPEIQAYFRQETGPKFALRVGKSIENGALADINWMKGLGHQFYMLDEAGKVELAKALAPLKDQWFTTIPESKKAIATEILKFAEERVQYYQEEFEKGTYGDYSIK